MTVQEVHSGFGRGCTKTWVLYALYTYSGKMNQQIIVHTAAPFLVAFLLATFYKYDGN